MHEMRNRHIRRERIKAIQTMNLFGKYEIMSTLGTGAVGTVYLAKHLKLRTLCAIKCIPKISTTSSSYLSEARILKILRHPGFPILYDYEEDETYFYLIEEYIQGDSLEVFALHQSIISETFIIQTGISLCELFSYLHTMQPNPIVYLDLKPEHIFLCGDTVKLIDFSSAVFLSEAGNNHLFYGTEAYSAPEVKSGKHISPKSDLYSLGKILAFLAGEQLASYRLELQSIIQKLTSESEELRFSDACQVRNSLLSLRKDMCLAHLSNQIAVISSGSGIGATHLAVSLVSVLNKNDYLSFYEEKNTSYYLQNIVHTHNSFSSKDGFLTYRYLKALPNYGEGIRTSLPTDGIHVKDYGVYKSSKIELDYEETLFFIMGCREWELKQTYAIGEQLKHRKHSFFICNYGNQEMAKKFARHFQKKVYCFPLDSDPFRVTKEKETLFLEMLGLKKGGIFPFIFGKKGN